MSRTYTNPDGTTVELPDNVTVHGNEAHIGSSAVFVDSSRTITIRGGTIRGGTIRGGTIEGGTIEGGTIEGGTIEGGTILGGTILGGTIEGGAFIKSTRDLLTAGPVGNERSILTAYRHEHGGWHCVGGCSDAVPLGDEGDPFAELYPPANEVAAAERLAALTFLRTVAAGRDSEALVLS